VPVSWGELIDKITILEIKVARIAEARARAHAAAELDLLRAAAAPGFARHADLAALAAELRGVNETLWQIEDDIRARERAGDFGADFIALARAVYRTNDRRAAIKRAINDRLGSPLVEVKQYSAY
jgi:hypothetical protein